MLQIGLLLLVLLVALLLFAVALGRANELFVLSARGERVAHRRGRIPRSLFDEIEDLLRREPSEGVIRVVAREGRPYVDLRGAFSEGLRQQIRNVVGLYPLAKIRAGNRPR